MSTPESTPPVIVTCGIDIGCESTKVVLGSTFDCEIVRNDVGGHTTPSAVSFSSKTRNIGATANINRGNKNAVTHVNRLIDGEMVSTTDSFQAFYVFDHKEEGITVEYNTGSNDDSTIFQPSAIIAMLLGKIRSQVMATMKRMSSNGNDVSANNVSYVLSVGPDTSPAAQQQLLDAMYAANMTSAAILVESSHCYSHAVQRKFPDRDSGTILICDMGHAQTSISVLELGGEEEKSEEKTEETATDEKATTGKTRLLTAVRNKALGAGSVDVRLWHHFQSTMPALSSLTPTSRSGQRLLVACQKLKQLLSQLPDASVTVENINDADIKLHLTRQELVDLCSEEKEALVTLIQSALGNHTITHVEAVGGGCRIPWVQAVILEAVNNETLILSHSLDDTSVALGAALIGELADNSEDVLMKLHENEESSDAQTLLRESEQTMALLDADLQIRSDTLNQLEAHILELRSAKHSKHGGLLPDQLDGYLNELDDWLFSPEADDASKDGVMTKLETTLAHTKEMCIEYYTAVREETEQKEREMEEEAKKAQLERSGQEEGDEDDHDNRRLPKKRRMEIVMKNKAEANDLFSGGNFQHAAARYTKALSHCAKFVDLSPDDQEEVNAVKLSLNLNLALMYMKLEKPDQALRVCNDALALDGSSAKALYRRASVYYDKKQWDAAHADVKQATTLAPDDKAIGKLRARIEAQQARQKQKEKKMAKKMFG